MVGKRWRLFLICYVSVLVVLFLMCSTDLIIREPEQEIYQVAVIIEDVRDDNYSNFRKGMDQAAMEYNADVRFITLYEKMDAVQQMELLERERQDGADALIVAPVDEIRVKEALGGKQTIPAVLLGSGTADEETSRTVVLTDYEKMGRQLAEHLSDRISADCPVLILSEEEGQSAADRRFLAGAVSVLEGSGRTCRILIREKEQGYEGVLREWSASGKREAVILAESPEILTEAAGLLESDPSLAFYVKGLYGRGSTLSILNDLDQGLITGVCVTDEFSKGYYSVRMAIQLLEGIDSRMPVVVDSYYIEKEDLRRPEYEKLLFPME